jgi:hypothetical protein
METIVRGGLLNTLDKSQLQRLGDIFEPCSPARLRQLLHYKLCFGAKNEYFLTAIQESVAFHCANAKSSTEQDQQAFIEQLLDAASIKRLQAEPWNLLKQSDPIKESMWTSDSHSPSNHVLAAMSYIGDERLVRLYLVNHKLDLRISHVFGGPMQCAASQGHLQIVRLLIDAHEDMETLLPEREEMVRARRRYELYPSVSGPIIEALYAAAYGGHKVIVHFLADLLYLRKDTSGFGGFRFVFYRFAVMGGHESVLDELVRQLMVQTVDHEGAPEDRPLLNWRIFGRKYYGRCNTLRTMITFGSKFGYKRAVTLALANDCDPSHRLCLLKDDDPTQALVTASKYGHGDIVKILLEQSASQKATDVDDAIIMASQRGFTSVVQLLFYYQLDNQNVNIARLSESSFQAAAKHGQVHVIDKLISLGLDVHMSSEVRRSAISAADENGYSCVARKVERITESGGWRKRRKLNT